jgi:hypothetical protein
MGWRHYRETDREAVAELHAAQMARVGEAFTIPPLDKEPCLVGLVYESEGEVTHAALLEAQAEFMALGETPLPMNEWDEADRLCSQVCAFYRIGYVRAFVPAAALETNSKNPNKRSPVERLLHRFGFVREDQSRIQAFTRKMG